MLDFYKAKVIKRLAAYVIDLILLLAITAGVVVAMFSAMNFSSYNEKLMNYYDEYGQKYGIDLTISQDEKFALPEEEQEKFAAAFDEMNANEDARSALRRASEILLLSVAVGFFIGYVILEIMLPLILKNGQTIGKKAMGLCVMHKYHVRVGVMQIIWRTILGKYFIETLIPVMMLLLKWLHVLNTTASLVLSVIAMVQGFIVMMSQANCGIHDKLFNTVVADFNEQYIFDTLDERIAYEEAYDAEMARREAAYGG